MAKLIRILAASIGSGMVLGFGVRALSDKAGKREQRQEPQEPTPGTDNRIASLERRLRLLEEDKTNSTDSNKGAPNQRFESHGDQAEAIRLNLQAAEAGLASLQRGGERFRSEIESSLRRDADRQIASNVDERIAGVEARLRSLAASLGEEVRQQLDETLRRETLAAVDRGLAGAVGVRISRLEQDVAAQSTAMQELRECAMHTERNMQKLLAGIDRLISAQGPSAQPESEPSMTRGAVPITRRTGIFS
ncbi:MAG TPA: hypothetical protein VNH18_09375 [Bryobacteraceae bacterium]|nr:hypothetical protein [Bryobacteraceae bacterium]